MNEVSKFIATEMPHCDVHNDANTKKMKLDQGHVGNQSKFMTLLNHYSLCNRSLPTYLLDSLLDDCPDPAFITMTLEGFPVKSGRQVCVEFRLICRGTTNLSKLWKRGCF